MSIRKAYVPPRVRRHDRVSDSPKTKLVYSLPLEDEASAPSAEGVKQEYVTLIDLDRRYVQVSDSFCQLLGYDRDSLVGKRYDDLTPPGTTAIPTAYNLFRQLGYMHELWILVARSGARILVGYESWLRSDSLIEAHMHVVMPGRGYKLPSRRSSALT